MWQYTADKERFFKGVCSVKPRVDLIIADMLEGLPISDVSKPSHVVPRWNERPDTWLESLFEFLNGHL